MTKPPASVHGRLYLLAFDRDRHRFGGCPPAVLALALRAAMVADLHLSGYLVDRGGRPYPGRAEGPGDPVLNREVAQFGFSTRVSWDEAIARSHDRTIRVVREQLQAGGWLRPRAHHTGTCLEPRDEDMVVALVEQAGGALQQALEGEVVNRRMLTLGLIAAVADLSCVKAVSRVALRHPRFPAVLDDAGPPIQALNRVLDAYFAQPRPVEDTDTCGGDDGGFAILW
ncbi:GPP34 family phosphoprotein [Mycobacterium sp. M26]|uniref:GPP34 family phosphoprotein n=1 Tax=Mycobacterium sp. M26 TaxID=1762962 RepID=UPI00073EB50F|nr:GPP34 family phosphoprotein [Mycobacterium sp. M26]